MTGQGQGNTQFKVEKGPCHAASKEKIFPSVGEQLMTLTLDPWHGVILQVRVLGRKGECKLDAA